MTYFIDSVYSTLFLDSQKLRNFHGIVRDVANGRCQSGISSTTETDMRVSAVGVYIILREASAWFARSTIPGNAKASDCGTGNRYGSHAFFCEHISR